MRIIGCDLHARQQTLAMLDTTTGEVVSMTLKHEGNNVRARTGHHWDLGSGKDQSRRFTLTASIDNVDTSKNAMASCRYNVYTRRHAI